MYWAVPFGVRFGKVKNLSALFSFNGKPNATGTSSTMRRLNVYAHMVFPHVFVQFHIGYVLRVNVSNPSRVVIEHFNKFNHASCSLVLTFNAWVPVS
jgi:hypothetical protein